MWEEILKLVGAAIAGGALVEGIRQIGAVRMSRMAQAAAVKLKEIEQRAVEQTQALDDSAAYRRELREENRELRAEIKELRKSIDDIENESDSRNQKYYGLLEEHQILDANYKTVLEQNTNLRLEVAKMEKRIVELNTQTIEAAKRISILESKL